MSIATHPPLHFCKMMAGGGCWYTSLQGSLEASWGGQQQRLGSTVQSNTQSGGDRGHQLQDPGRWFANPALHQEKGRVANTFVVSDYRWDYLNSETSHIVLLLWTLRLTSRNRITQLSNSRNRITQLSNVTHLIYEIVPQIKQRQMSDICICRICCSGMST